MPICAFCKRDAPATKEHVWPRALIDKYESLITYNPVINKMIRADPIVRDVCAECNNKSLSQLDSYLAELFDEHFAAVIEAGESVSLTYHYERLARALLKISFNSSRAVTNPLMRKVHEPFASFILNGGYRPRLEIRLQIVTTAKAVNSETGAVNVLRPEFMRCGVIAYDGPMSSRFVIRMVAINSFWFYLVLQVKSEKPHKWAQFTQELSGWKTPLGITIPEREMSIEIPVNKSTFMHPELVTSWFNADRA